MAVKPTSIPFGDLLPQYQNHKEELDAAINRVLQSGWFVLGKEVEGFEKEFADYCGSSHCIGVGSGTEAIHLALCCVGVKPGDEVITVPNTAVPTVSAISFAGAVPRLVDIDPKTFTIDVSKLEAAITPKTKAIVPVHLYGQCADLSPIMEIAGKHGIAVIEDACQAHGAEYKGKKAGSIGDIGCFSFYPSKNLGAFGDGGATVTSNPEHDERLRLLRNYGQKKRYHHSIEGFNSRLDEMQAAILRAKLKHLGQWNELRKEKAALYSTLLQGLPIALPFESERGRHAHHLYVIETEKRDELQEHLANAGIGTLIHYPVPVHLQDAYRSLGYDKGAFPVAEEKAKRILSLPLYPELENALIEIIAEEIRNFLS